MDLSRLWRSHFKCNKIPPPKFGPWLRHCFRTCMAIFKPLCIDFENNLPLGNLYFPNFSKLFPIHFYYLKTVKQFKTNTQFLFNLMLQVLRLWVRYLTQLGIVLMLLIDYLKRKMGFIGLFQTMECIRWQLRFIALSTIDSLK